MEHDELWDEEEFLSEHESLLCDSPAAWRRLRSDPRSTLDLIDLALATEDSVAYLEAINILQVRAGRDVLDAARALCASPQALERKLGCAILGRLGDSVPELRVARRLRMSGSEQFQSYADELYAKYGPDAEQVRPYPKEALATLLPMLETEDDIDTLRDVLCAVAEYQELHPTITEHIAALRTHPCADVRFTVTTRLLLDIENTVAVQALKELAEDADEAVAEMARESLSLAELHSADTGEEAVEE